MKKIMTLFFLCFVFFSPVWAQQKSAAAPPPPSTTTSSIEYIRRENLDFVVITTRQFKYVSLFTDGKTPGENYKSVLLLEEVRTEKSDQLEGENSAMRVDAWLGSGIKATKKAWSIKADANIGEPAAPFYKATKYGCCAASNVHTWYNLLTGQKIFTGTENLLKISVPNTSDQLDRYLAFHSNMGASDTPEHKRSEAVMGVLQYGSARRGMYRIVLRSSDKDKLELGDPEIGAKHKEETVFAKYDQDLSLDLWGFDGKNDKSSLSNFTIILKWENFQITIPVKNDMPQLAEAQLPPKVTLEFSTK